MSTNDIGWWRRNVSHADHTVVILQHSRFSKCKKYVSKNGAPVAHLLEARTGKHRVQSSNPTGAKENVLCSWVRDPIDCVVRKSHKAAGFLSAHWSYRLLLKQYNRRPSRVYDLIHTCHLWHTQNSETADKIKGRTRRSIHFSELPS